MPAVRRPRPGAGSTLRALLYIAAGAVLAACGSNNLDVGTPVVTISSTNAHFTRFVANISGISLTRDDGSVFTLLAAAERADFTRITDLSELLTAPAFPDGTYKTGTITVDLSSAIISVDVNGQSVQATPVDDTGAALTSVTLTLNLDASKPLVINNHQGTPLGIDFDLAASTIINSAASPLTVTVAPFILASVVLPNSNPVRVHGAFLAADQKNSLFIVNSRPFNDQIDSFGAVNITTNASTTFDIDGHVYAGAAGLKALGGIPLNSGVAAIGSFTDTSPVTPVFAATQVYAGASQEGVSVDHLNGDVVARSGDTLTIQAPLLVARGGAYSAAPTATLTVGPNTIVNIDGSAAAGLNSQAVSVGQHIEAVGQATVDATSGAISLDATAGEVRLKPTRTWGTLTSATPGSLVMNLASIGPFEAAAFNFSGTGVAPASDASAASYLVNTGAIDQSATPAGTLLRIDGQVNAFGSAPPDFTASAVTAGTAVDSILEVEWPGSGATAPFSATNVSGLVVDLGNASLGAVHVIETGPARLDLMSLPASPLIVADTQGTNYSVGGGAGFVIDSFTSFSGFVAKVTSDLNGTTAMRKLVAVGRYDAGTNTFTARRIDLVEK